jgi:hypothetical protein
MKPEQIEEQLRSRPPDEPAYRRELVLGPRLIRATAAKSAARESAPRALLAAAALAAVIGLVVVPLVVGPLGRLRTSPPPSATPLATSRSSSELGLVPWIDATPTPAPTPEPTPDPRTLPVCTADDVAIAAGGWGGATGSLVGGVAAIHLGGDPCILTGKPGVSLLDARGSVIATANGTGSVSGSPLVVLPAGGVASVTLVWSNSCGAAPARPLTVKVTLPGDEREVAATVRETGPGSAGSVPRCDSPAAGPSLGVPAEFAGPEPSSGGYEPEACAAADLGAYLGRWGGALGSDYANLALLNTSSFDCLLPTSPTVEIRDATGKRMLASEPWPSGSRTVLLPSGWAASVFLAYSNWCTPPPAMPLHADIVLGSGRVSVEAASGISVPACMTGSGTPPPSLLYTGPLTVPGAPIAPEPDPTDSLPIAVVFSALPTTQPGATLEYTVTLANISAYDKPINLAASCPSYSERLMFPGSAVPSVTTLRLNCESAGVLEPGVPKVFSMRLPIAADAPLGTATLVWQLGERGPSMKAAVTIAR